MTYKRLPYDDAAPTSEMVSDCTQVGRELHMPLQHVYADELGHEPLTPSFGPHVVVSDELAALAAGLELHFD
jgi:hypothetical protein